MLKTLLRCSLFLLYSSVISVFSVQNDGLMKIQTNGVMTFNKFRDGHVEINTSPINGTYNIRYIPKIFLNNGELIVQKTDTKDLHTLKVEIDEKFTGRISLVDNNRKVLNALKTLYPDSKYFPKLEGYCEKSNIKVKDFGKNSPSAPTYSCKVTSETYLNGELCLQDYLKKQKFNEAALLKTLHEWFEAIELLHKAKYLHAAILPRVFKIGEDGQMYLGNLEKATETHSNGTAKSVLTYTKQLIDMHGTLILCNTGDEASTQTLTAMNGFQISYKDDLHAIVWSYYKAHYAPEWVKMEDGFSFGPTAKDIDTVRQASNIKEYYKTKPGYNEKVFDLLIKIDSQIDSLKFGEYGSIKKLISSCKSQRKPLSNVDNNASKAAPSESDKKLTLQQKKKANEPEPGKKIGRTSTDDSKKSTSSKGSKDGSTEQKKSSK